MTIGADLPPGTEASAAGESAPPVLGADAARTDALLPAFVESMQSKSAADSPCTSLICQMDPGTGLVLLTLYMMLCFAVLTSMLRLIELLRTEVWESIDLLWDACVTATRADRR